MFASPFVRSGFPCRLNIEVGYPVSVFFDVLTAPRDVITHQAVKHFIGSGSVLNGHLQHAADLAIHRGVPKFIRVHFTQTLEALKRDAFIGEGGEPVIHLTDALHSLFPNLAVDRFHNLCVGVEKRLL